MVVAQCPGHGDDGQAVLRAAMVLGPGRGWRFSAIYTEVRMEDHKFAVGQTVQFTPGALDRAAPRGTYKIVRLLPPSASINQYRIKSTLDGHERVVQEGQLAR
jgi:hypothetical protein